MKGDKKKTKVVKIEERNVEMKNHKKVCVDLLEEELKTPITTQVRAWRIIERLAACFVSQTRSHQNLALEVYGNGTPGGLKKRMIDLENGQANLESGQVRLEEGQQRIENQIQEMNKNIMAGLIKRTNQDFQDYETNKNIRQKTELEKHDIEDSEDDDWFRGIVKWFVDKCLPGLVNGLILLIISALAFFFALSVGWLN